MTIARTGLGERKVGGSIPPLPTSPTSNVPTQRHPHASTSIMTGPTRAGLEFVRDDDVAGNPVDTEWKLIYLVSFPHNTKLDQGSGTSHLVLKGTFRGVTLA